MLLKSKKIIASTLVGGTMIFGGLQVADNQINPYVDKGTTLEIKSESVLPEGGEVKNIVSKDEPAITLSKWNGEVTLKVKSLDIPSNITGSRPFLSKNVEWDAGNVKMESVPIDPQPGIEDGGMEINIILNSLPASNVFTFQLDNWENLDFFYQAPLWQEAGLKAPTKDCTDTDCTSQTDGTSHRPDNVVGSYAVYYKDHANHKVGSTNYATGKAYQIFRPLVTDNSGQTTWADLSYSNGVLSVTVPQSFLDNASYPVKVDPTFGYTTIGGTQAFPSSDRGSLVNPYTASSGDTITQYSYYSTCTAVTSGTVDMATYTIVSGKPNTKLGASSTFTINTFNSPQWFNVTVSIAMTGGTVYDVAAGNWSANCSGSGAVAAYLDAGTPNTSLQASGALPASWSETSTTGNLYSWYATYTASGGGAVVLPTVQIQGRVDVNGQLKI